MAKPCKSLASDASCAAMKLRIVDFAGLDAAQRAQAAGILRRALAHMPSAFDGPGEAEAEVALTATDRDRRGWAALDGGTVVGWIGAIAVYSHGWELHPLAVDPASQGRGVGAALVAALEAAARAAGVLTVYLGTDDDYGGTSLFGRDLFPGAIGKAASVEVTTRHPIGFYRRLGYEVVGVMPDVNGAGRPDIYMAKRVGGP
jgi:aminoglycoside 6'-N-acetyltransferase I